jgi:hypothetical protein
MADEYGWLIETGSALYWNGRKAGDDCSDAFVHNPNEAVRFCREEDAEVVRNWLFGQPGRGLGWSLRSVRHKWVDGNALRQDAELTG